MSEQVKDSDGVQKIKKSMAAVDQLDDFKRICALEAEIARLRAVLEKILEQARYSLLPTAITPPREALHAIAYIGQRLLEALKDER